MFLNPYKYKGPLGPKRDKLVCVPRREEVERVIENIMRGEYWAVLGPRQMGKTTFLRLIKNKYTHPHYIYFSFGVAPSNEKKLYQLLINRILKEIPSKITQFEISQDDDPGLSFIRFLENFKPKKEKKIILFFDEIDGLPCRRTFLHMWRKVYIDRYEKATLDRYAVIITGSVDLIELTDGPTSPFNIAEILYLRDFSIEESERLIDGPMKKLNINIEPEAKKYLISQLSGHPQLLQQICYKLVDMAMMHKKSIIEKDINNTIEALFNENLSLDTLRHELRINNILADLIRKILKGKKIKFFPYKEFSISGAGAIVKDDEHFCAIRNKIFEKFLKLIPEVSDPPEEEQKPVIFISYSHKDEEWRELISRHLNVLGYHGKLSVWDDRRIRFGDNWLPVITKNIDKTKAAILLISADFLSSKFVLQEEIPRFLKKKKEKGMHIFPIIVRPCLWQEVEWLNEMQIRPSGGDPISLRSEADSEAVIVEILKEIVEILKSEQETNG